MDRNSVASSSRRLTGRVVVSETNQVTFFDWSWWVERNATSIGFEAWVEKVSRLPGGNVGVTDLCSNLCEY